MDTGHPLPFVTVLVPCRNEAGFIDRCLESILGNGYPVNRLEVLVVDGMSEDGTRELLDEYTDAHPCVRVIDNPGRTTPKALNVGLQEAQGRMILRVDAHARLGPGYIRGCVEALQTSRADVVCGIMMTVPATASPVGESIAAALSHPFGVGNSYFRIHVSDPTWVDTVFCGCYRREVFDRVRACEIGAGNRQGSAASTPIDQQGPFNADLTRGQDMDLSLRLRKVGGRMLLVPGIRSDYYARSTLSSFWRQNWNNGVWAILPFAYSDGMPISLRHLIPLLFVAAVLVTGAAGLALGPFLWLSGAIFGTYVVINVTVSLQVAWRQKSFVRVVTMPFVFTTLHVSYGLGSLWGLVRLIGLPRFWRKIGVGDGRPSTVLS